MSDRAPLLAGSQQTYSSTDATSDSNTITPSSPSSHSLTKPPPSDPTSPQHFNLHNLSRWDFNWILVGLWGACFLGALDTTIVATLLTAIGSSFEKSHMASWLGSSYLLSVCCFTPVYGRLCDIAGRKGSMLIAITAFLIGTIMCGIAPSMEFLIFARAIAGIGGGGMMTVGNVIMSDLVPLKSRGTYQGFANLFFAMGGGLGGPLGGYMAESIGWRWAFLIQIPPLIICAIVVYLKVSIPLPTSSQTLSQKLRRIDFLGSLTLVTAVASILVALTLKTASDGEEIGWGDARIWGLLVVGGVMVVVFVGVEGWVAREPIMPLSLLLQRTPACICSANFLLSMSVFSLLYNFPLWFSAVKLTSSSIAGSHLLPNSIALAVGSLGAGLLMRYTGKYYYLTVISCLIAFGSTILLLFFSRETPGWLQWVAIVPNGLGMASVITTTLIALIGSVRREEIAVATGITYLFRTTGQVLGVSISASITQSLLKMKLVEGLGIGNEELITRIRHSTSLISHLDPATQEIAISAYEFALNKVFLFQAVAAGLAVLSVMGMQEVSLGGNAGKKKEDEGEQEEGTERDTDRDGQGEEV